MITSQLSDSPGLLYHLRSGPSFCPQYGQAQVLRVCLPAVPGEWPHCDPFLCGSKKMGPKRGVPSGGGARYSRAPRL